MNTHWRPPTLVTERLILRPVLPTDADDVFAYSSNPELTKYTLFETHQSLTDSRWFVEDYVRSRYVCQEPDPFGIVLKDDPDGRMVGALGGYWASKPNGVMEIGYSLAEPHWNRGLITEACHALIEYILAEFPVQRLQARVLVGNNASERVLAKLVFLGFRTHRD